MSRKTSRKLSVDAHRKLSAISNCSDVSNFSVKLGMNPNDFRTTINNILELDIGDAWEGDSDEESLSCYGDESYSLGGPDEVITVKVDRKSSTGSNVSSDSLDAAEAFEPVQVDMATVKTALNMYQRHKKVSMSKVVVPRPGAPQVPDIKE